MCTTRIGSTHIQQYLDILVNNCDNNNNDRDVRKEIFDFFKSISSFCHVLCTNQYGHYLIVKLLSVSRQLRINKLLKQFIQLVIMPHFCELIKHQYPCEIIQDMLKSNDRHLSIFTLNQLKYVLKPNEKVICQHLKTEAKNQPETLTHKQPLFETNNSNQIYVQNRNYNYNYNYNNQLLTDIMNHRSGNIMIQTMISTCVRMNFHINTIDYIFDFIVNNVSLLARNKFGCYVVQCCITDLPNNINNTYHEIKFSVFKSIYSLLPQICNCKYGKHCVEKCLHHLRASQLSSEIHLLETFIEYILFVIDENVPNYSNSIVYDSRYSLPYLSRISFEKYMSEGQHPHTIPNFSKFSFGQFSSGICDIAIEYSTIEQKQRLINYLCNSSIPMEQSHLFGMVNHIYANFPIKNLIETLINSYKNCKNNNGNNYNNNHNNNNYNNNTYNNNNTNNNYSDNNKYTQHVQMLNMLHVTLMKISDFMIPFHNNNFTFDDNVMYQIREWYNSHQLQQNQNVYRHLQNSSTNYQLYNQTAWGGQWMHM